MKKIGIILTLLTLASCVEHQNQVSQKTRIKNNNFEIMYFAKKDCRKYASADEVAMTIKESPYQRCVLNTALKNGYNLEVEVN